MFDSLADEKLRAAHDVARLLYDNHRALKLDPRSSWTPSPWTSAWNWRTGAIRSPRPQARRPRPTDLPRGSATHVAARPEREPPHGHGARFPPPTDAERPNQSPTGRRPNP
jgi:hypothetical protein